MGRHKFRLSDMIPNAWFYKLRDMRIKAGGGGAASRSSGGHGKSNCNGSMKHTSMATPRISHSHHHHRHHYPSTPTTPKHGFLPNRASYYYTPRAESKNHTSLLTTSPVHPKASDTHFPPLSPPRKSKRRHRRRVTKPLPSTSSLVSSPVSAGCRCGRKSSLATPERTVEPPDTPPCRRDMYIGHDEDDEVCKPMIAYAANDELDGRLICSATDIIIDLRCKKGARHAKRCHKVENSSAAAASELVLPPILTKPVKKETEASELVDKHIDVSKKSCIEIARPVSEQSKAGKPKRSAPVVARRLRTRGNSPRVVSKKTKSPQPRKAAMPPLTDSFAVVKSSSDPRRDFLESMKEMISENGIHTATDLEDLLACYLSLNAAEYHDLIVEVFEQIWGCLADIKL